MDYSPKISLIIPVYNVEKYLRCCLESISAQTFLDFEIICIDDSSTDTSYQILKEFQLHGKRLHVYKQKHSGAWAARNYGISLAKGEYIQFLDSDDYAEPTFLEKMYNTAREYNSDITVCSYKKVDDNGYVTEIKNPNSPINLVLTPIKKTFNKYDFKTDIFTLLTPVPWNKLYKKELITDNNILFPKLNICEDIAFVHSCVACAERILVLDDELINYRYNRAGSMATYRTKFTIDVVKSCMKLKEFLIKKELFNEFEDAFVKAFKNHIRWEIALCKDTDYENFLGEFKRLMPNDWEKYKSALKKDYLTYDYLKKIIGKKRVMLWGASYFIQNLLAEETDKLPNILGIIDKNQALWGKQCGNYIIYPPEALYDLSPDAVVMTIWSNNDFIYPVIERELKEKHPDIQLLANIFEEKSIL